MKPRLPALLRLPFRALRLLIELRADDAPMARALRGWRLAPVIVRKEKR